VAADFDIIIVGSGAGGGTLAHTLARTGKRILILERGSFVAALPVGTNQPGEPAPAGAAEMWYDAHQRPFQAPAHYYVGGATKLYGAALCRLRPADFGRVAHLDGESPAWPLGYAEFEPWYAKAEWLYQVHGLHGEDPTEGSWSAEYLWPPVTHEPVIAQLAHELTTAGYQPFHTPTGFLSEAPADADVIAVRPLLGMLNVTLLVDAEVTRLQTDPRGRSVTGVVVNRDGRQEVYRAGIVVLAAGAVNSARILLRSASDTHPAGLANRSGQVGRNLMCHNRIDVTAAVREPHNAVFPQTLGVNDFYLGGRKDRWPLGSIALLGDRLKAARGHALVPAPRRPASTDDARAIAFRLTTEDLPRPANRVTVDGQGRVGLAHVPTGDGVARLLFRSLRAMLSGTKLIAHEILDRPVRPAARADGGPDATRWPDYAGTCRFGADPATSVLDVDCRAHELDNLYVVDSSFFPSIGALSPALTVMANAIRVGEHLAARLGCWPARSASAPGLAATPASC
jgi:choline dehydrogenase-like flavoprotein